MNKILPDKRGYFSGFGGRYVPETLMSAINELEAAYQKAKENINFQRDLQYYFKNYIGRPSLLYYAKKLRDWVSNVEDTYYMIGSVVGPHPYPMIVRDFQSVIGKEAKEQILSKEGRLPDYLVACVGGGSNSIGLFYPFLTENKVKIYGVEAAGHGLTTQEHAATLVAGNIGILHGAKSFLLQDEDGQIKEAYSIAAGLDYPGVGPEHAYLKETNRANYVSVTDDEALEAFQLLSKTEGIIPALETAHALAYLLKLIPKTKKEEIVVVCLSGRGDKDTEVAIDKLGVK